MSELKLLDNGNLISKSKWDLQIGELRKEVARIITDKDEAINIISEKLVSAMRDSFPDEKFAILFSGGIDSTIIAFIAKQLGKDFVCYAFGIEGARDVEWARKAASELGFELKVKEVNNNEFKNDLIETIKLINELDAIKISVGAVFYPLLKEIKKDGLEYVYSGLGSEEIFAGYQRHTKALDITEECWNGLSTIFERDFTRDVKLINHFGLKLKLPFLDKNLVNAAMKISSDLKICGEYKKYILRLACHDLGLPKDLSFRKKKAAQYGSKVNKAFRQIARKEGFDTRKEFVRSILCSG